MQASVNAIQVRAETLSGLSSVEFPCFPHDVLFVFLQTALRVVRMHSADSKPCPPHPASFSFAYPPLRTTQPTSDGFQADEWTFLSLGDDFIIHRSGPHEAVKFEIRLKNTSPVNSAADAAALLSESQVSSWLTRLQVHGGLVAAGSGVLPCLHGMDQNILRMILSFADIRAIGHAAKTCKQLKDAAKTDEVWLPQISKFSAVHTTEARQAARALQLPVATSGSGGRALAISDDLSIPEGKAYLLMKTMALEVARERRRRREVALALAMSQMVPHEAEWISPSHGFPTPLRMPPGLRIGPSSPDTLLPLPFERRRPFMDVDPFMP